MPIHNHIAQLLLFGLPAILAGIAHMVAVRLDILPTIKRPLDNKRTYQGKRIFGDNKTWRGLLLIVLFSIVFSHFTYWLITHSNYLAQINILNFTQHSPTFYGLLYGLGYSLAELPNSFYKRQQSIQPGQPGRLYNVLLDQVDSVLGCLLILYPFSHMTYPFILKGILFYSLLHIAINALLYTLGIRKNIF